METANYFLETYPNRINFLSEEIDSQQPFLGLPAPNELPLISTSRKTNQLSNGQNEFSPFFNEEQKKPKRRIRLSETCDPKELLSHKYPRVQQENVSYQEQKAHSPIKLMSPFDSYLESSNAPFFDKTLSLKSEFQGIEQQESHDSLEQKIVYAPLSDYLTEEEIDFYAHQQPSEWFPLSRNKKSRINCKFPSHLPDAKRIIYIFENTIKNCYLVGKTGAGLKQRFAGYNTQFNKPGSELEVKKIGRRNFLTDVKTNPEDFKVGILHILKPEEDLNYFETLFIDCMRIFHHLYNDHRGGGGGSAHLEQIPTTYAVPKVILTPVKYYPFCTDPENRIRAQLTPNFDAQVKELKGDKGNTQQLVYVIMNTLTKERYIGVSNNPKRRSGEHARAAERLCPENVSFNPDQTDGCLHPAMAEHPDHFAIGLLPIKCVDDIPQEELHHYILLNTIAETEKYSIKFKESLVSQGGLNCNAGGGGPIPSPIGNRSVKRLVFNE